MFSDKFYCEVRDWLMMCFFIDNSGRSGVVVNIIVNEFNEVVFYFGIEENNVRYRVDVKEYKIVGIYGVVNVWIYDDLYFLIEMYMRMVRK